MTKKPRSEHAQAASAIRKQLKKHKVKATVRSQSYSMGSSIDVVVADMSPSSLEKLNLFCEQFRAGSFNGMTDSYEYKFREGPTVSYVFIKNEFSPEVQQACWTWLRGILATLEDAPEEIPDFDGLGYSTMYKALREDVPGGFWSTIKPRHTAHST